MKTIFLTLPGIYDRKHRQCHCHCYCVQFFIIFFLLKNKNTFAQIDGCKQYEEIYLNNLIFAYDVTNNSFLPLFRGVHIFFRHSLMCERMNFVKLKICVCEPSSTNSTYVRLFSNKIMLMSKTTYSTPYHFHFCALYTQMIMFVGGVSIIHINFFVIFLQLCI